MCLKKINYIWVFGGGGGLVLVLVFSWGSVPLHICGSQKTYRNYFCSSTMVGSLGKAPLPAEPSHWEKKSGSSSQFSLSQ